MDAGIAVAAALAVVYPRAGNISGGGFLVYRTKEGEILTLDFRERAPKAAFQDMFLDESGAVIEGLSLNGARAVGVPGTIAGLIEGHQKLGHLPFEKLFEPATRLAKKGFRISEQEASRLNKYKQDFIEWNGHDIPFVKDSEWQVGDVIKQSHLAKTLEEVAKTKGESFYHGRIGDELVEFIRTNNGIITTTDLQEYECKWRKPISCEYKGFTIHTMPLPSSGGVCLSQILESLNQYELTSLHSPEDVHLIAEIERRAYADRAKYLGDPDFIEVPLERILDPNYLKSRMDDFDPSHATSSSDVISGAYRIDIEGFETTHISIVDTYGNALAFTTTLNSNYGSKLYYKEGGFFLNNEMDDFSVKPGTPNQFGLVGDKANAIQPGKRMLSSMTPTIVEKNGQFFMALGTPGGSTIITSVLQVFLNVTEYGLTLSEAIDQPRFHHQWLPDVIFCEPPFRHDVRKDLELKGHKFQEKKYIGMMDAILKHDDGTYEGGSDKRGDDDTRAF